MKQKELIKYIESKGFYLKRNGHKHKVFTNGIKTIMIPHSRTISHGLIHTIIKQAG